MVRRDIEAGKAHVRKSLQESAYAQALKVQSRRFLESPEGRAFLDEMNELSIQASRSEETRKRHWKSETGETDDPMDNLNFYIALAGPDEIATVLGCDPADVLNKILFESHYDGIQAIRGILKRRKSAENGNSLEIFPDGICGIPDDLVLFTHWIIENCKQTNPISRAKLAEKFFEGGNTHRRSADSLSKEFGKYLRGEKPCRIVIPKNGN